VVVFPFRRAARSGVLAGGVSFKLLVSPADQSLSGTTTITGSIEFERFDSGDN